MRRLHGDFRFLFLMRGVRRFAQEKFLERSGVAERKRRHGDEQRSQFYVLLRSRGYLVASAILGTQAKGDKNSIVQSAALYIRELKGVRNELQRRNEEFKARLVGDDANVEGVKVKFEVANPSSTIDSMIGALRCLKNMDVKARAMRSNFSGHVLLTVMSIETKMSVSEVEKAIEGALANAETNKNQFPFHGSGGWALNSHVENMT
ncbi:transcription factor BHLH148 isoform X2 [Ananas comosus]|uniref:Transcription factor BHLH148 isoform X2 n=1 Tax=Ananas comosus TaxID=4615 RepID=A0A6P5F0U6_ANACO|nr:transcription factor BHLH148 isoform X2 [Ananas comosus]